jgi:leucyl-tRNA synthetase
MTLAPEHELVDIIVTPERREEVVSYVTAATNRSERERMAEVKNITGVFTGAYAIHPFTGKKIPIWIGDYVLAGYGTGAVMAVPGHDSRDYAFAKHFKLPIPEVVSGGDIKNESYDLKAGKLINSDFLNGLEVTDAIKKAVKEIENKGVGIGKINFRLRDAIFGRQRYWGEPIPIYYRDGIACGVKEKDLPVILPEVDKYLPTEDGEPPLARAKNFRYNGYPLETTTMPGWAGSSWYYLRYMDAQNDNRFASEETVSYWKNVDLYMGGAEHATGHLLYVRFWTKFMYDRSYIPFNEPAKKLINQGMIQGRSAFVYRMPNSNTFLSSELKDQYEVNAIHVDVNIVENDILDKKAFQNWREEFKDAVFIPENGPYICGSEIEKMSKSKYNVVNPDEMIDRYGADCLRLYEMFLGPLELAKPWNTNGITGTGNFIRKLWRLFHKSDPAQRDLVFTVSDEPAVRVELKVLHRTIKKVIEDIERFSFNTSVSNFMICVNELTDLKCNKRAILEPLVIIISPYAPHIAEELWQLLGNKESVTKATFPLLNEEYLIESEFAYPVSVNGKTKINVSFPLSLTKEEIEKAVLDTEDVKKLLKGDAVKKVIVVPGRIINIVI